MSQMDTVTQKNAASAEESASASEELNAQAESMMDIVGDLIGIVTGAGGRTGSISRPERRAATPRKAALPAPQAARRPAVRQKGGPKVAAANDVIPMDDDFDDF